MQNIAESGCVVDGIPTLKCFEVLFSNIIFLAGVLVVIILFVMLLIGSFQYLTSGGDSDKIGKAQGTIKYAMIGLLLFMGSYLILNIIQILFLENQNLLDFRIPEFEP